MLEDQFSQFGEIHLQFPNVYKGFFYFLFLLAVYFCTTACDRDYGAGGDYNSYNFTAIAVSYGVPRP